MLRTIPYGSMSFSLSDVMRYKIIYREKIWQTRTYSQTE